MNIKNDDTKSSKNEKRIDQIKNLVEKEVRTERHLEEHSDIAKSPENIAHAKELQQKRECEIQNLTNIIAHGEQCNNDALENTEKRFKYTEGYLNHNVDHMDEQTLENTKRKQENRKDQIDTLK